MRFLRVVAQLARVVACLLGKEAVEDLTVDRLPVGIQGFLAGKRI
jgi:hypothetical protein